MLQLPIEELEQSGYQFRFSKEEAVKMIVYVEKSLKGNIKSTITAIREITEEAKKPHKTNTLFGVDLEIVKDVIQKYK